MKYLLPYLVAGVAFFAGRHFRPVDASAPEPASLAEQASDRSRPRGFERRVDLLVSYENASPTLLETLRRSGRLSREDRWELIRKSAEADPQGTWDWVEEHAQDYDDRTNARAIVARVWFPRDPEAVIVRLGSDFGDRSVAAELVGFLGSDDPATASAAREHLDVLVQLARVDPYRISLPNPEDGSGDLILSLPEGPARDFLARLFATHWLERAMGSESGITGCREWLDELPGLQRDAVMSDFFSKGGARALAETWLLNEASDADRARCGPRYVEWLAEEDPAAALAWAAENLSSKPLAAATASAVSRLFASDPDEARRVVENLPPGNLLHRAATEVARQWSATDPVAAVEWWLSLADPAEAARSSGITPAGQLGKAWFDSDPDSLRARIADPDQPALPGGLTYHAISQWTRGNPDQTLEWASSLPPDRRELAVKDVFGTWARENPAAAALALRTDLPPIAGRAVAASWYERDRAASIEWAADLPAGPLRNQALEVFRSRAEFEVQLGGEFPPALRKLLD